MDALWADTFLDVLLRSAATVETFSANGRDRGQLVQPGPFSLFAFQVLHQVVGRKTKTFSPNAVLATFRIGTIFVVDRLLTPTLKTDRPEWGRLVAENAKTFDG